MLNVEDDSSEEDEELQPMEIDHTLSDGKTLKPSNTSAPQSAGLFLLPNQEDDEVDEPIPDAPSILLNVGEDQDEIDEPLPTEIAMGGPSKVASTECSEALSAIAADAWDISSWVVLLEEVENGRGGETTLNEVYEKILIQFPKSAKFWKNYALIFVKSGDLQQAEEKFNTGLKLCKDIKLWESYLSFITIPLKEMTSTNSFGGAYSMELKKCTEVFQLCIDSVGLSMDSFPLWRSYLDFVKSWPETDIIETRKKLSLLREIYRTALSIPMEQSEEIWVEYEALEKAHGDQKTLESNISEYSRKYLHAKSVYKERKKLAASIVFDRLATPPTNSFADFQQLECWDNWIRFELGQPDYLNPEGFVPMIRLIFEQCLCCFRYNPEIWLSYSRFELQQHSEQQNGTKVDNSPASTGFERARAVLLEAIEANPKIVMLRVALAELLETEGNQDEDTREVLRMTFEQIPGGFTFSLLQRFVRRQLGVVAARQLFGETRALRLEDPAVIGLDICLAHAKLEYEVNCDLPTALKVLHLAQVSFPASIRCSRYVLLLVKILAQQGDLQQIRWVFQQALDVDDASELRTAEVMATRGGIPFAGTAKNAAGTTIMSGRSTERTKRLYKGLQIDLGKSDSAVDDASGSAETLLRERLLLWDEYLRVETMLGQSNVSRLNLLRINRNRAKTAVEEATKQRMGGLIAGGRDESSNASTGGWTQQHGLFGTSLELVERYQSISWSELPPGDNQLRQRSIIRSGENDLVHSESDRTSGMLVGGFSGASNPGSTIGLKRDREAFTMSTDFQLSMGGLPLLLRDFLSKLPFHIGPAPDVEGFLRHMKGMILPPRPAVEVVSEQEGGVKGGLLGEGSNNEPVWLRNQDGDEEEDTNNPGSLPGNLGADGNDIFRQRQRSRLMA